ncbi:titin-like protein [Labeo rohita]|uniref:Titin-like protein n=1 Tax=Labeo rohita TaxID=84645 RepID=A0A498NN33_LABRO|nr:titin-like protein [Labeo rohita]
MNFCSPLICGLILFCICFGVTGSSEELSVTQSPSNITVNEGESAQITCCWSKIEHKVKFFWYINVTKLSDVQQKLQEREEQNCSILILTNILKNATGRYVCEVTQDIPFLKKVKTNGTALDVSDSQIEKTTTGSSREVVIIYIFRSLPFICLLVAFFYLNRDDKRVTTSRSAVEHAVKVGEGLDEDLEAGEIRRNETEEAKQGSSREVVIIYIFRSLPFICLLVAFFYLNRDDKRVTTSRSAVEHAVEVGEGLDEDLEAGEIRRNETEEAKQSEKVSEQEKDRVNNEKPKVTAVTEEEKDEEKQTVVIVNTEQVTASSEELSVTQSPSNITVNEGESAKITCCWSKIEHKVKFFWYINVTKLSDVQQKLQEHEKQNCSILILTNILKNATGRYVCEVIQDIPFLKKVKTNGTTLDVSDSQIEKTTTVSDSSQTTQTTPSSSSESASFPIMPLSLAASIGLLTLCLAFSVCKMRNSCKKSERVVIHQGPQSEGEEHENMEEEDGSTDSSRGSLQWYQVPVYWSYFDLRRGEDQ